MIAETRGLSPEKLTEEVKKLLATADCSPKVVCFDFFDTLVTRSVIPETTKRLAATQLSFLLASGVDGAILYGLRRELEAKMCNENVGKNLDADFNLYEFAKRFFHILSDITTLPPSMTEKDFVEIVADIEVQMEISTQRICPVLFDLLVDVKKSGITTCLISDFYLPGPHFKKILEYHSLDAYLDAVYVSADYSLTKGHSGRLYGQVCQDLECAPSQLVMIGDNEHADFDMARKGGLRVYHLDHMKRNDSSEDASRRKDSGTGTVEKKFLDQIQGEKNICFPEMALSLWLFTHRLFEQLVRDQVSEVFFCSKEGEFLRRLFLEYQQLRFGRYVITPHYLLVSRKSTYICSLKPLPEENFSHLFTHYQNISLTEFLQSLNFSHRQTIELCRQYDLDPDYRFQQLSQQKQFKMLLDAKDFQELYETHRKEQRENFHRYLNRFNLEKKKNEICLVDVGWKGSIQNNIYFSLKGEKKVRGYFLGLLSPTELSGNNSKKGILFSDVPCNSPFIHVYNNNRSLFEMVLGASHGSADGYFTKQQFQNCKEERQSTSFVDDNLPEDLCITVLDLPKERTLFERDIRPIQEVLLKINRELTKLYVLAGGYLPDDEWFARHHARMVFEPTKKELEFYSRLYHLENFGLFEFTDFRSAEKISLGKRIKNLKLLLQNPTGVLETGVWPPIILKRLGLEFLQPIDARKRYRRIFGKNS